MTYQQTGRRSEAAPRAGGWSASPDGWAAGADGWPAAPGGWSTAGDGSPARVGGSPAPAGGRSGPGVGPPPARRGATGPRLAVAVFWLGLVVSVLPWWYQTADGALDTTTARITAAGRISGLLAGYLLLVQVLLASRLPLLERLAGAERLGRWHRDVGATLLVALLSHVSLILVGYARLQQAGLLDELTVLLRDHEDMLSAFAAAGILVVLGLTAVRAIRTALPYELWHRLHMGSYLVLLLGYGHQFAGGQQLFRPGPARTWWIALYLMVLAALLWGRVIAPVRFNLRHRLRVADVVAEGPEAVSVYVTGRRLDRLRHLGGQFLRWRFLAPARGRSRTRTRSRPPATGSGYGSPSRWWAGTAPPCGGCVRAPGSGRPARPAASPRRTGGATGPC
ncbi:ferric reductase-like transmembrane domain-containing protein [Plantactinospora sp. KBS50]|uniref:ferric reductase-like transmembrane domain-containing protein n=1 Tax=Plantactinospora sp. KBS50 TaxID=2024580 RepID=UPI0026C57869|nr:ferric reductase-like transmembrane domain-containing protein [Plantactinospora sp. KBS50]